MSSELKNIARPVVQDLAALASLSPTQQDAVDAQVAAAEERGLASARRAISMIAARMARSAVAAGIMWGSIYLLSIYAVLGYEFWLYVLLLAAVVLATATTGVVFSGSVLLSLSMGEGGDDAE